MQLKYLKNIHSPKDIRDFTLEQLQELCDEIRNYTIETVKAFLIDSKKSQFKI